MKPEALFAQMNAWRNEGLEPHQVPDAAPDSVAHAALAVYKMYRQLCSKNNAVDFSDLIMHVVHLFRTDHAFRSTYRNRWRHVLVDEYQDTNPVQLEFVRHLVTKDHSITVVGDDCQAIHEWRGARVKNILEFPQHFTGTSTIKLEMNYRSVSNVLTAANNVIKNNQARTDKKLQCTMEEGEPLEVHTYKGELDEARGTAKMIKEAVKAGTFAYGDVAVLYRINAMSQNMEKIFREHGIPYRIVGSLSFFERMEVKDVLAYLRLAANPSSDIDFRRVVNVPGRGVGNVALQHLAEMAAADGCSMFEAAFRHHGKIKGKAGDGVRAFLRVYGLELEKPEKPPRKKKGVEEAPVVDAPAQELPELPHRVSGDPLQTAIKIINDAGYMAHLTASNEHERVENVKELLTLIHKFVDGREDEHVTLREFLSSLMLAEHTRDEEKDADANKVTMMSMHASKGLEFGMVFLVGLGENSMPYIKSVQEGRIEEERRLMYVGITRAKKRLVMSYPTVRYMYFGKLKQAPSRFLDEISPVPVKVVSHVKAVA